MPTTPYHLGANIAIYYVLSLILPIDFTIINCIFLLSADFIDLDHLLSKPIYKKMRDPFKTHILHKNWKLVTVFSMCILFFYPYLFIGLGLLSHILLDYLYYKYYLKV